MNTIKSLQKNLAIDLVNIEESDIKETTLEQIEEVYQSVYDLISKIDRQKD
jgi:hypothetical protein